MEQEYSQQQGDTGTTTPPDTTVNDPGPQYGYDPNADIFTNMQNYQNFGEAAGEEFQEGWDEWWEGANETYNQGIEDYGLVGGIGAAIGNVLDFGNTLGGAALQHGQDVGQWWQGNDPFYTEPPEPTAIPEDTGITDVAPTDGTIPGQEGNTYDVTTPEGALDESQTYVHEIMDELAGEGSGTNADGSVDQDNNPNTVEGQYAGETATTPGGGTVFTGSEADDSLQPAENTAVTNVTDMANSGNVTQGNIGTMSDVVDTLTEPTELGSAIENMYNQSVSGELTGPNAAYYDAQSDLMDRELDEMMREIKKEYSNTRGLGGTNFSRDISGAVGDTAAEKMGVLSDLAKTQSEQASDFYNTQQGQRIDAGQTGVALAQGADETSLGASQTALDYIANMRGLSNEEANTELNKTALAIKAGEISLDAALEEYGLNQQLEMFAQQFGLDQEKFDFIKEQWETQMDGQLIAAIISAVTGAGAEAIGMLFGMGQ